MYEVEKETYAWDNPHNPMKDLLVLSTQKYCKSKYPVDDNYLLDAGILIKSPSGKLWHILQAPTIWKNGEIVKEKIDYNYSSWIAKNAQLIPPEIPTELFGLVIDEKLLKFICHRAKLTGEDIKLLDCQICNPLKEIDFCKATNCLFDEINISDNNVIKDRLIFVGCEFAKSIYINFAVFKKEFVINESQFCDLIYISKCKFESDFRILETKPNEYEISPTVGLFDNRFNEEATIGFNGFNDMSIAIIQNHFIREFQFIDNIGIKSKNIIIDHCNFDGLANFDSTNLLLPCVINGCKFKGPIKIAKLNFSNRRKDIVGLNLDNYETSEKKSLWKRMETGSQELRLLNSSANDKLSEWAYYDIEHYAKLQIAKLEKRFVPFDYLYEICSGNGLSLTKPLIWLFLLWLVPSLIYLATQALALIHQGDVVFSWNSLVDGFVISASQMVLGSFKGDTKWLDFISDMEKANLVLSVFDRIVAFSQNLFSIVLVFLFGLAIRRRYQV